MSHRNLVSKWSSTLLDSDGSMKRLLSHSQTKM